MLRLYEVLKRLMFYITKQVLNEPPWWNVDTQLWLRWQQREPCLYGIRRKPPRDLEIEHVSCTVAFVYNHMPNGLWLSQLHSGRPMHWYLFRLTGIMHWRFILALVPGRCAGIMYWEDFYGKTLSHSRSTGTPSW